MGKYLVVLDPGHGGWEHGIKKDRLSEKEINLQVCLAIKECLNKVGVEVWLTREQDCERTAEQRASFAEKGEIDLFLSWHCDFLEDPDVQGVSISVQPSAEKEQLMIDLERIGDQLCEASGQVWLGVFQMDDKVLAALPANTRAGIVHGAYLSNVWERGRCADAEFLRLQAQGAAEGILSVLQRRN